MKTTWMISHRDQPWNLIESLTRGPLPGLMNGSRTSHCRGRRAKRFKILFTNHLRKWVLESPCHDSFLIHGLGRSLRQRISRKLADRPRNLACTRSQQRLPRPACDSAITSTQPLFPSALNSQRAVAAAPMGPTSASTLISRLELLPRAPSAEKTPPSKRAATRFGFS